MCDVHIHNSAARCSKCFYEGCDALLIFVGSLSISVLSPELIDNQYFTAGITDTGD